MTCNYYLRTICTQTLTNTFGLLYINKNIEKALTLLSHLVQLLHSSANPHRQDATCCFSLLKFFSLCVRHRPACLCWHVKQLEQEERQCGGFLKVLYSAVQPIKAGGDYRYCSAKWIRLKAVTIDRSLLKGSAPRFFGPSLVL